MSESSEKQDGIKRVKILLGERPEWKEGGRGGWEIDWFTWVSLTLTERETGNVGGTDLS